MRLVLTTFLSLDGVVQAPGHPDEDRRGGFDRGGWQLPYVDDEALDLLSTSFRAADAFLFGRRTYEIFAGFWPNVTDEDNVIADRLNTLPKHVVSTTEDTFSWRGAALL